MLMSRVRGRVSVVCDTVGNSNVADDGRDENCDCRRLPASCRVLEVGNILRRMVHNAVRVLMCIFILLLPL